MAELTPEHLKGQPGYEGYLNERSLSIAQVLKDNGYRTYISGKWHLGLTRESNAHAKGFDHSFTLLQGLDHHFKQAPSAFKRNSTYTEDGQTIPISALPDDFFSTNYFTDKLLSYLDSGKIVVNHSLLMLLTRHLTGQFKPQPNIVKISWSL